MLTTVGNTGGVPPADLVEQNLGLVFHIARELTSSATSVTAEELLGPGTLGLMQAAKKFDSTRGVRFSSFAVPRVRGAMLDALRADDAIPRNRRSRARQLQRTIDRLASVMHRCPTTPELARALGLDDVGFARWEQSASADVMPLHELGKWDSHPRLRAESGGRQVRDGADWDIETRVTMRQALHALPETERAVLELYYLRGLRMWQVGDLLNITESQVSKVRKKAVAKLRAVVADGPSFNPIVTARACRARTRSPMRRMRRTLGNSDLPAPTMRPVCGAGSS